MPNYKNTLIKTTSVPVLELTDEMCDEVKRLFELKKRNIICQ
nr:MAG TPA: hypothetical protein [Caudoviricetes sp.]